MAPQPPFTCPRRCTYANYRLCSGRLATVEFYDLPNKKDPNMADYYRKTKMPLSINMIEDMLKRKEFTTMTMLESYWKRLVQNAKDYNQRDSLIHRDAERIRKLVLSFMQSHNPAYDDEDYQSFPVPIPEGVANGVEEAVAHADEDADAEGESDVEMAETEVRTSEAPSETPAPAKRGPGRQGRKSMDPSRAGSSTPASEPTITVGGSFEGLTFQQAQEKLIKELLEDADE